jgi:stage II sporulation SpoE-like protein
VAPFHPLRYETRVLVARALAACAVFCAIALALLAGSGSQVANAEAKKDKGAADGTGVVVQDGQNAQPEPNGNGNGNGNGSDGGTTNGNGNGNGNGWGRGGADKSDPPDPVEPETPPTPTTPAPPTEPAPSPSDGNGDGKGNGGETPTPTGGGKGNTADPEPTPTGNTGGSDPTTPTGGADTPADPPTSTPSDPTVQTLSESPTRPARANRIRFRRAIQRQRTVPNPGAVAGVGGTQAEFEPAPAAAAPPFEKVGKAQGGGDGSANPTDRRARPNEAKETKTGPPIIRSVPHFVQEVPAALKFALAVAGLMAALLGFAALMTMLRNRSLDRQRRDLLQEVGLLQSALLPPVPDRVGGLRTSVAYRPADGPGAGGDFYDVLPLPGGRVGFILGDVSGHGRGALARTAFMRYTLRAYLEAGLEPRVALQVAGRVIDENLGGDFATVLLAVHDPETGSLTYATAGHPAPLVVGPQPHEPVTAGSSPPIGVGVRTGLRQTTVPLVSGSVAAMFTDGLLEARVEGGLLGRERLSELLDELGDDATARGLVQSVNREARVMSDDVAAVVIQPTNAATAGLFRTEQLELSSRELDSGVGERFLEACGVAAGDVESALYDARMIADRFGGVILHVVFGNRLRVEVLPRNVESIEAASRRAAAATR